MRLVGVPDSKTHVANMAPTWVLSAPDGPHVGPMNFAIRCDYTALPAKIYQSNNGIFDFFRRQFPLSSCLGYLWKDICPIDSRQYSFYHYTVTQCFREVIWHSGYCLEYEPIGWDWRIHNPTTVFNSIAVSTYCFLGGLPRVFRHVSFPRLFNRDIFNVPFEYVWC